MMKRQCRHTSGYCDAITKRLQQSAVLPAVIALLSCLALSGCRKDHHIVMVNDDYDTVTAFTDSVEEPEKVKEPEKLEFNSATEAVTYMRESPDSSRYMSGILPRMAEDELSYTEKLLNSKHPYFFIVDKAEMELVVFDRFGVEIRRMGMACSKNYGTKHKQRDNRTPEGFFSAKAVYNSEEWLYTDDDGKTSDVKGQFGPRFIRLNIPVTTQIGIHGTVAPWSIGHRRSHGCIRVTNENIMDIIQYVDSGMPVIVSPGYRDMAVNREEGYYVPSVATRRTGPKADPDGKKTVKKQESTDTLSNPAETVSGEEVPDGTGHHTVTQDSTVMNAVHI